MWPLRRALEHCHGKFPRAHRRCSPFRNANNGDATRANDHLRVLRWHNCPLRNRELLWNFRPPPSVSTDFSDQIFDHNSISSSLFASAHRIDGSAAFCASAGLRSIHATDSAGRPTPQTY